MLPFFLFSFTFISATIWTMDYGNFYKFSFPWWFTVCRFGVKRNNICWLSIFYISHWLSFVPSFLLKQDCVTLRGAGEASAISGRMKMRNEQDHWSEKVVSFNNLFGIKLLVPNFLHIYICRKSNILSLEMRITLIILLCVCSANKVFHSEPNLVVQLASVTVNVRPRARTRPYPPCRTADMPLQNFN